jgi:hypothetical protein
MKLRLFVSAICFAGLVLGFQNCSKVSFAEKAEMSSESVPQEPIISEATQSFTSSSKKTPIDMVWVIDNSGSMSQNVARVRENFAAFAATLKGEVDIKFALISRAEAQGYNTSIRLSDYTTLGTQIPFMVHSFNPMLVLAATTCKAVVDPADKFCAAVKANSRYDKAYGSLNSFFRDGSQKVFVFVTDDDSRPANNTSLQFDAVTGTGIESINVSSLVEDVDYITPATFVSRMTSAFGSASSFKTFGFVAQSAKLSPCYARESTNYQNLIASSDGGSFNICDKDWSANFKILTSSVINYAASTYTVSDEKFTAIESVSLNGMTLKLGSDYVVDKNVVTLNSSLFENIGNYDVQVIYKKTE